MEGRQLQQPHAPGAPVSVLLQRRAEGPADGSRSAGPARPADHARPQVSRSASLALDIPGNPHLRGGVPCATALRTLQRESGSLVSGGCEAGMAVAAYFAAAHDLAEAVGHGRGPAVGPGF